MWSGNPNSEYLSERFEIRISERQQHPHVHCGTIHDSRARKQPQCLPMDEVKLAHSRTRMPSGLQTAESLATCNNTDELWGHPAEWTEPARGGQMIPRIAHVWNSQAHRKCKTLVPGRGGSRARRTSWRSVVSAAPTVTHPAADP